MKGFQRSMSNTSKGKSLSLKTVRTSDSMESSSDSTYSEKLGFDDVIVRYLGQFGKYQRIIFFLVCIPTIITSMDSLSWTFSGAEVPHRCKETTEGNDAAYSNPPSLSLFRRQNCSLAEHPDLKECPFKECSLGESTECPNGFVYDVSKNGFTAIQRWDIVCDKLILRAVIQSMYYVGQMIGSLIFGFFGDRIGRKKVFFIALVIQFFSGFAMGMAPHWSIYALGRLGTGMAHPGIFVIAVVIGVELIGPKYRQLSSILASLFWSTGQVLLATLAYFVGDYRILHACIAFPALLFVSYWWLIPESARWLVAHKKYKEADEVLRHASKMNGTYLPPNWYDQLVKDDIINNREHKHHNFIDLIRTPVIRKRALASFFCWPVISMLYYGVSMNSNFLGGDLYLSFIFGGLSEFPALILTGIMVDKIGRKPVLIVGFVTAAFAMLSSFVWDGTVNHTIGITQSIITKSSLASTYSCLYIFTPELFPTVIRNTAMGACSMMARIGAITSSYVAMWLVYSFGKKIMIIPFAGLGILAALTIAFCLPETTGMQLHETIEDVEKNE